MNPELPSWQELRSRASENLSPDLSRRILTNVAIIRRKRRELLVATLTVAMGLFITVATEGAIAYQQQQQNLTRWNELVAVTETIEGGL